MEKHFRYRISIEWSDEDAVYIARVPALPGCMADGETPADAAREIETAATALLEVMAEKKQYIPPSDITADYSGQTRLRMPPVLHRSFDELATAQGMSLNSMLLSALAAGLGVMTTPRDPDPRVPGEWQRRFVETGELRANEPTQDYRQIVHDNERAVMTSHDRGPAPPPKSSPSKRR